MTTIAQYFEQAQLSLAAYALDLLPGMSGTSANSNTYIASLKTGGMSQAQADAFAATYAVVDQYTDPLSGFSATIFDKGGVKYFAIRGTETPGGGGVFATAVDWLATNAADVGADGVAISQGIELINYLQRLYGAPNSAVVQYGYNDTLQQVFTTTGTASGELAGNTIAMNVAGHSLGGHLAMMASRLAPGLFNAVYTFNAPGFDTELHWLYPGAPLTSDGFFNALNTAPLGPITGAIGASWNAGIMTHLDVPSDVVHGIGSTPGAPGALFSEKDDPLSPVSSHSIQAITDSLALYNLLATLDPTLDSNPTGGIQTITNILKASSNVAANTLESAVSALGKLFLVNGAAGYNGNEFDGNRDLLYTALNDITAALPAGGYTLRDLSAFNATQLASVAQDNLAYRYALVNGNPFALDGNDAIYTAHNTAGELNLFDTATGQGTLTAQYLTDRSDYLTKLLARNVQDSTAGRLSSGGGDTLYRDIGTGTVTEFRTGSLLAGDDARKHLEFGSDQGETISGGSQSDRIYGMGGNDTLQGNMWNKLRWHEAANDACYETERKVA